VTLWLLFGAIAAGVVVFEALRANLARTTAGASVEGSNDVQQKEADAAQQTLARDSSDVDARIRLGNVLYDTKNWSDAIVQYRAAIRRDSTRVAPIVDLGVCYYNLGETTEAERLFHLALARDAHQPVALFNLGVVRERHGDTSEALDYYHRALASRPDESTNSAIEAGIQRLGPQPGKASH
jgi:cytochrome c-type biogenesis protein CcmH/NrfG